MGSFLVAFWTSGPDLRSQWGTLAHFLEKGVKKVTNGPPTEPPNGTVLNIVPNIFIILYALLRELGGDWLLGVLVFGFCGSPKSGVWI